jgi:hypothetical protein
MIQIIFLRFVTFIVDAEITLNPQNEIAPESGHSNGRV